MNNIKWPIQFLVTMILSTFIQDNVIKTIILLVFWVISFYPLRKLEFYFFIITSFVFTFSNYGALKNLTFDFTAKDVLLMPYNELFMWGFYCLNAHRFIGVNLTEKIQVKKMLIYSILFAISFSILHDEILLTSIASIILIIALIFFRSPRAFKYIIYFLFMGVFVESMGLTFNLWHYPHAKFKVPLWAPLMWGNIGLIMSLITAWIFNRKLSKIELVSDDTFQT